MNLPPLGRSSERVPNICYAYLILNVYYLTGLCCCRPGHFWLMPAHCHINNYPFLQVRQERFTTCACCSGSALMPSVPTWSSRLLTCSGSNQICIFCIDIRHCYSFPAVACNVCYAFIVARFLLPHLSLEYCLSMQYKNSSRYVEFTLHGKRNALPYL